MAVKSPAHSVAGRTDGQCKALAVRRPRVDRDARRPGPGPGLAVRHPGTWGWECRRPARPASAAARERCPDRRSIRPLQLQELPGLADAVQHVFWSDRARQCGEPGWETTRLEWIPLRDAAALTAAGRIRASSTAAALLHLHASLPRNRD